MQRLRPRITITCKEEFSEEEFEKLTELAVAILALDWDIEVEQQSAFGESLCDWAEFAQVDIHDVPLQALADDQTSIGVISYMDEAFPMFDDVPNAQKIYLGSYDELVGFSRKGMSLVDALLPR